jgi:glycosyltransferase involved in cell wall biosynthesis
MKRKILFLGETYRADAKTWMNGLIEFGDFEIVTFELKTRKGVIGRFFRVFESLLATFKIKKIIKIEKPDMIIAERITSYGFLAATTRFPKIAIAQQGITDIFPKNSITSPIKRWMQKYAFKHVNIVHAWGEAMTASMFKTGAKKDQIFILPKGIDLRKFKFSLGIKPKQTINAIVTRSLFPEYCHDIILKAFANIKKKNIPFKLTIVGDGILNENLKNLAEVLDIQNEVNFTGRIRNENLPDLLSDANLYISTPITEGVSASLFEAMASGCYPIVSDLRGNRSWIRHHRNGALTKINDVAMLTREIEFFWKNIGQIDSILIENRYFIESHVSYEENMKIISDLYHNLIDQKI